MQPLSKSLPLLSSETENKLFRFALDFSSVFSACTDSACVEPVPVPARRCEGKKLSNNYAGIKSCPAKQVCRKGMRYSTLMEQSHSTSMGLFKLQWAREHNCPWNSEQPTGSAALCFLRAAINNHNSSKLSGKPYFPTSVTAWDTCIYSLSLKMGIYEQVAKSPVLQDSGIALLNLLHCSTELVQISKTIQLKSQPGFVLLCWRKALLLLVRKSAQYTHVSGHTDILWHCVSTINNYPSIHC